MGNTWDFPRLPRDIQDFQGVMRGDGSGSQAKVRGGGRLHGAQRWTMEGLSGVLEAYWVCMRDGRRCAHTQPSGRCPEVAEQQAGDTPKAYDI